MMRRLTLAVAGLLVSTIAQANTYDRYLVTCRIRGDQQTLVTDRKDLPNEVTLKVKLATVAGESKSLLTTTKFASSRNLDTSELQNALTVVASATSDGKCSAQGVHLQVGRLDAGQFKMLLELLGAKNVPDLTEILAGQSWGFGSVEIGTWCEKADYSGTTFRRSNHAGKSPVIQLHFSPDRWDGLSYHILIDRCKAVHIRPDGDTHRLGH